MTALDALLPGLRQRPDPAPKSPDAPARDTEPGSARDSARDAGRDLSKDPTKDAGRDFGRELDRLERPQGRGGRRAAAAADDAPAEVHSFLFP